MGQKVRNLDPIAHALLSDQFAEPPAMPGM